MTSVKADPTKQSILRDAREFLYNFSVILSSPELDNGNINELERFDNFLIEYKNNIPQENYIALSKDRITLEHLGFLEGLISSQSN